MDQITEQGASPDHASVHYLNRLSLPLKVFVNPNFFVPNKERADHYLHLDRSSTTFEPDFSIPIGGGYVRYKGHEGGGVNDRPIGSYQEMLFPDDYEEFKRAASEESRGWTAEGMLEEHVRKIEPKRIFGGYEEAFKAGKTVLDIGCGQALALMQLSLRFPNTTFIGLDILYHQELPVFPGKPGLQLTKGDWRYLNTIPNRSIDTILSCQGIAMWGLPKGATGMYQKATSEDGSKVIAALERVTKPGAVIRMDFQNDFLMNNINKERWEVDQSTRAFIAKRKT